MTNLGGLKVGDRVSANGNTGTVVALDEKNTYWGEAVLPVQVKFPNEEQIYHFAPFELMKE